MLCSAILTSYSTSYPDVRLHIQFEALEFQNLEVLFSILMRAHEQSSSAE
jgi:hypothetical protein